MNVVEAVPFCINYSVTLVRNRLSSLCLLVTITDIKVTNLYQLLEHLTCKLGLDVISLSLINTLKSEGFF